MRRFAFVAVPVVMVVLAVGCRYVPEPPPADALVRDPVERMLLAAEVAWFLPQAYPGGDAAAGAPLLRGGRRMPVEEAYSPRPALTAISVARPGRRGPRETLERHDAGSFKPAKPTAGRVEGPEEPLRKSVVERESAPPVTPAPRLVAPGLKDLPRWEALPTK